MSNIITSNSVNDMSVVTRMSRPYVVITINLKTIKIK
jgi:hypothetical protein